MKVLWFNGNLGNQVFYCKYKDYLLSRFPKERVYAYVDRKCPSITVDKLFNLTLPDQSIWVNFMSFIVFRVLGVIFRRVQSRFVPKWYCGKDSLNDSATFIGHSMQTNSYYKAENSSWLEIKIPQNAPKEYFEYAKIISSCDSVAIHIRRGDYLNHGSAYVDLSTTDYYDAAIAKAKEFYPHCHFFIFSDDMNFAKSRYKSECFSFVDSNRGSNSYLDIKLMSLAKVVVMANSTFSYWASYIDHERKIVIYPKRWFCEWTGRKAPDIMMDNWIGL